MMDGIEETTYDDEDAALPPLPVTICPEVPKPVPPSPAVPIPVPVAITDPGAIMLEPKPEKKGSIDRLLDGENLKNVIKTMFQNAEVVNTNVKKGASSSANIYVHKKHLGKRATVIIWND